MINKEQNTNLQITLKKTDYLRLLKIKNDLSELLQIDISKSETIAYLIKNYGANQEKQAPKRQIKKGINYGAQVRALKDKLNVSYPRLSEILGIPPSTLKKYANETQAPKGENEKILLDAIKRYGIK